MRPQICGVSGPSSSTSRQNIAKVPVRRNSGGFKPKKSAAIFKIRPRRARPDGIQMARSPFSLDPHTSHIAHQRAREQTNTSEHRGKLASCAGETLTTAVRDADRGRRTGTEVLVCRSGTAGISYNNSRRRGEGARLFVGICA